jgi:hypothetical protein
MYVVIKFDFKKQWDNIKNVGYPSVRLRIVEKMFNFFKNVKQFVILCLKEMQGCFFVQ